MVCERLLQVAGVEVEAAQDDADGWVEGRAGRDGVVVGGGDGPAEGGVAAAEVGEVFRGEFRFNARFAEDEGFVAGWVEAEDARYVDGRAVGGAEDFVLGWGRGGGEFVVGDEVGGRGGGG